MFIILLLIIVVFYLIPVIYLWWFYKKMYSPKGKFKYSRPHGIDVVFVLCPGINFIGFVDSIFDTPYEITEKNDRTLADYFFCVKKDKRYEQEN